MMVRFTMSLPWPENVDFGVAALDGNVGRPIDITWGAERVSGTVVDVEVDRSERVNRITIEREVPDFEVTDPTTRILMGLRT